MLDPAHPAAAGSTPCYALDIAVAGTRAYAAGWAGGLLIFDISDPAAPVRLGRLHTPGYSYGVAVSGTLAYVAEGGGGLRIIDVSNAAAPAEVGSIDDPGENVLDVVLSGSLVLLVVQGSAEGLRVLVLSNAVAPVALGFCPLAQKPGDVVSAGQ